MTDPPAEPAVEFDGEVAYVADPLPAGITLNDAEREAVLDNYRWFSRFSPYKKLLIAWSHSRTALHFQRLSRGIRR